MALLKKKKQLNKLYPIALWVRSCTRAFPATDRKNYLEIGLKWDKNISSRDDEWEQPKKKRNDPRHFFADPYIP